VADKARDQIPLMVVSRELGSISFITLNAVAGSKSFNFVFIDSTKFLVLIRVERESAYEGSKDFFDPMRVDPVLSRH
jgi:hypothetical protein